MKKTIAILLAALMLLTLGAGTVTATGNPNTSLNRCTNAAEDYYGGIKVYARDKANGPSRVMCPHTYEQTCEPPLCGPAIKHTSGLRLGTEDIEVAVTERSGDLFDRNLNRRNRNLPLLEDIWHGFDRNIESFKLRAAAGCYVATTLWHPKRRVLFRRGLDNRAGTVPKTRLFEVPGRKDDKATKVYVGVVCFPGTNPD